MIGTTRAVKAYAYAAPVDMRKGYDGLYALVKRDLGMNPISGDLFLFVSRNRVRAKVLIWDGTGLCIYAKRLEKGRFACLWGASRSGRVDLTVAELCLFLDGCALAGRIPLSPAEYVAGGTRPVAFL